jgi:hypothetical protein
MKNISEIKKKRTKALHDLDMAIRTISPELDELNIDVEEKKMEFLLVWRKFQIGKCDEKEFLQASKNLAKVFLNQEGACVISRKVMASFKSNYEKTCDEFQSEVFENE